MTEYVLISVIMVQEWFIWVFTGLLIMLTLIHAYDLWIGIKGKRKHKGK